MDVIVNFSKCSRVAKVHLANSENGSPGLPKTTKKKPNKTFPGSTPLLPVCNTIWPVSPDPTIYNTGSVKPEVTQEN